MRDAPEYTKHASIAAIAIGLWSMVAPFVLQASGPLVWTTALTGIAVALLGGYTVRHVTEWKAVPNKVAAAVVLLGLWLVGSPFVLSGGSTTFVASTVASGLLVAGLAGYDLYEGWGESTTTAARPSA